MAMLPLLFAVVWGVAAGSALDQTSPEVHKFTAKYVIGAEHDEPMPYEDKNNAHKR